MLVTLAALAVRLAWNLFVHPPADYAFSDMGGYIDRAREVFDMKLVPEPYRTLFPWGTHALVFLEMAVFGKHGKAGLGALFALVGAAGVAYAYAVARRLHPTRPLVVAAIGFCLVVYYPWISLSGYVLSEPPFCACVSAAAFYALRLVDRGRSRDAWALGAASALGALFRPQMLVGAAAIGAWALLRRRAFRRVRLRHAAFVALPVALALGVSAARIEFHNRHFGLVSTNGPLNFVFGRCHNAILEAHARDGRGFFGPPAFGALEAYEKRYPDAVVRLEPARGRVLRFRGHMWDERPLYALAEQCIQTTGWAKQASYAATHVALLFGYDTIWPDGGIARWRRPIGLWCRAYLALVTPALVFGLFRALSRRRGREGLVAAQIWALVLVAIVYFGEARYRAPYDGLVFAVAFPVYADAIRALLRRLLARA